MNKQNFGVSSNNVPDSPYMILVAVNSTVQLLFGPLIR